MKHYQYVDLENNIAFSRFNVIHRIKYELDCYFYYDLHGCSFKLCDKNKRIRWTISETMLSYKNRETVIQNSKDTEQYHTVRLVFFMQNDRTRCFIELIKVKE